MNKIKMSVVVSSLFVLVGCGASQNAISGAPNASAAYNRDTGECDPYAASREDYYACRKTLADAEKIVEKEKAAKRAPTPTPMPAPIASVPVPAPTPVSAPTAAPVVAVAPVPVAMPTTLTVVPTAIGPVCKAPAGTKVSITNDSDFPIRIMSSDVAPLNCDVPYSLSPACVANADGSRTCTAIIPPHITAQFVITYRLAGMMPQLPETVRMKFTAHVNLGPSVLAPQTGKAVARWFKPTAFPTGAHVSLLNGDFVDS